MNILKNSGHFTGIGSAPDCWRECYIRDALKPVFNWNNEGLSISGNGNPYIFGYWMQEVDVIEGVSYRLNVKFKVSNIYDVNLNVLNMVCWKKDSDTTLLHCPYDHVSNYDVREGTIVGESTFMAPPGVTKAEIQLGLRYSEAGEAVWYEVEFSKAELPGERQIKVTTTKWQPYKCETKKSYISALSDLLDKAGIMGSDMVLLPEFTNRYNSELSFDNLAERLCSGYTCDILSDKAIKHNMNICASILEKDEELIFNTAVIFDRKGQLVGKYRKTHLYWPEAFYYGESPGDNYPVFDLDFGKVGVMICYDNWYGETARLLALKGAELILYPNEGYERLLMHARAIDNRVYIAVSSLEMPSIVVDTKGNIICEIAGGLVTSTIDLNYRPAPYPCAGGTLNSSAGGRRSVRNSLSNKLYSEIFKEINTWQNRPENYLWLLNKTENLLVK